MDQLIFDDGMAGSLLRQHELEDLKAQLEAVDRMLDEKDGPGSEFLGWLDWPAQLETTELKQIQKVAEHLQGLADVLVVIGIGGSYLGARAAIEMLTPTFGTLKGMEVHYAGHHLNGEYMTELLAYLENKQVAVNVISKSGTTTEPAIAFRLIKEMMERKYGKSGAKERIVVTTDAARGALKNLADKEGYETFVIPDDIGGRYSVLTPVGLLPIAAAGIDIEAMIRGAREAQALYLDQPILDNACYRYAAIRNILHRKGKTTEILATFDPAFQYLGEWWKQLFGESEGKDHMGIFPASLQMTTDLHSMGQYVQDGQRILFETMVLVADNGQELLIPDTGEDDDGLGYLAGKPVSLVNHKAMEGTAMAHMDGGVPVLKITIPKKSAYWTGHLFYFFMKACAVSGYLLGVNPFNQPGVEAYKANMFALLGKPGSETLKEELERR
ncbi:glucose-6-phosphate isomerase [Anoxynatronum buryatiense]|uniref:Glucose-6-phosphate isomerase n=1 Tax=Anoxynatronum buryatiense TaxID=489973 RepID=A0AA45WTG8_9CLOT|nr:glucose-6-phosphate isomerase [Anoxynatronum buryatiense]SMP41289.1 glucose-6-phosphate isomerase [Anoxynatronum buryatiense]